MVLHLPPEEPDFGPWKVVAVQSLLESWRGKLPDSAGRPGVIAVDGRSASGKSTLAGFLHRAVPDSAVVHTDDVPSSGNWHGAAVKASNPSGNIPPHRSFFDWTERLLKNVLEPARAGQVVRYRPRAWEDWKREGAIEVPSGCSMLILEGVGAARHELMHVIDVVVWIQSDVEQAETRGIARDGGDAGAVAFWERWMAEEFPFLADQRPWERADVVVAGTPDLEYDLTSQVVVAV